MAGINAHLKIKEREEFILRRDESYIGVLIDDLVIKGVDEPYRMFTSRAEYRILLRQDNADERLTERSFSIGLAGEERMRKLENKLKRKERLLKSLRKYSIEPKMVNGFLKRMKTSDIRQKVKLIDLVLRPEIKLGKLLEYLDKKIGEEIIDLEREKDSIEIAEIEIKYNGYIKREALIAEKIRRLEDIAIDSKVDYDKMHAISTEARQKLKRIRPLTIGQASRISGVSPSDINIILLYLGR